MAKIALISCVSKKCSYKTKAEYMYTSPLFTKSLRYAKEVLKADTIFILSAEYGLLSLDKEIEPYNRTLLKMKQKERSIWAENVLQQLKEVSDTTNDMFYILAGKKYYQNLTPYLPKHEILMEGFTIGIRLQWLNAQLL